ncbi:MAG: hypothetical protein JRD89_03995 [Deltaproteobacteria bacterium]|nr:hypothetical protein [Deltaproteobacteria bacterium]
MVNSRGCLLWEAKEEGTEKINCGTCKHYIWEGFGKCRLIELLLDEKFNNGARIKLRCNYWEVDSGV